MARRAPVTLFVAAAGPRLGFGHLVRCGVLASVLGVPRRLVLRAGRAAARVARQRGWRVAGSGEAAGRLLVRIAPDLVVIDDPSARHSRRWVRAARRAGVPIASIHDLALGRAGADLTIDGGLSRPAGVTPADLQGPAYAILDPSIARWRARATARRAGQVLVALGGGAHVRALAPRLAAAIRRAAPRADVVIASGLLPGAALPALPAGCRWLASPGGLAPVLAAAEAAVVAGGLTMFEACALGTPAVVLPVVPAQRLAAGAFARAGAVLDAGGPRPEAAIDRAAAGVAHLLAHPRRAARLGRQARDLVDGGGAQRVARRLIVLAGRPAEEDRHVA